MTEGTDTDPPTRYQTLRDGREFFVLFEHEDRKRAAEARRSETLSARIARNRGWLPIAPTPSERRYVSGLAALNLECPWNRVGDWHRSMWMAPAAEINEKLLWVEAREWATNTVLGREGVYDARGALRRCESRWTIAGFGIGGHPQGYGTPPVYAAGHARAVIDMAHGEFSKGKDALRAGAPQPLEAAQWLAAEGQRDWACSMAQRLQRAAEPAEATLWETWWREIKQIEREGSNATRRWNQRQRRGDAETDRADGG